jgi:hypothetical protein
MSLIINNSVNYTLYYNVLEYFKTILTNHPSIAHVSQGDLYGIDTLSFPAYPIANIMIDRVRFSGSTSIYSCQLLIADKPKNKENASTGEANQMKTKYLGTDDVVDIHANTLAILNDILSFTQYGTTNFDITSDIVCEGFIDRLDNGLAGWAAGFELVTHNDRDKCLFDLFTNNDVKDC